jgi:hypothetical protein
MPTKGERAEVVTREWIEQRYRDDPVLNAVREPVDARELDAYEERKRTGAPSRPLEPDRHAKHTITLTRPFRGVVLTGSYYGALIEVYPETYHVTSFGERQFVVLTNMGDVALVHAL